MKLSVIIPMFNEERAIEGTLRAIIHGTRDAEIIVADGGSTDRGPSIVHKQGGRLLQAARGRASQMNAGAKVSGGNVLAFVHADTLVPPTFAADVERALGQPAVVGGRFDVRLDDSAWRYRVLGAAINLRSRLMRSATGDQAIFVRRAVFEQMGGFREIELCEDVDFMRRLRRAGRVVCLRSQVTTSARRWRRGGMVATIARMWLIKALFLVGVSPALLKRLYADIR